MNNSAYSEYEKSVLKLQFVEMQIQLRQQEGNQPEVLKLLEKKTQLAESCDELYCEAFMQKTG